MMPTMVQDDLDRALIAWAKLQRAVNGTLPGWADRLRAARAQLTGTSAPRQPLP